MLDQAHWLALAVVALVVLSAYAAIRITGLFRTLAARRRARIAVHGERRGERLLARAGYRVLERQPRRRAQLTYGGEAVRYEVRADALAARGSRIFVAEMKTGALVSDLHHGPTRRQLLEYNLVFGADGVLLIDVLGGTVREVCFRFE
jgi:hypothetical protein